VVHYSYDAAWRQTSVCIGATSNCYASAPGYTAQGQPAQWSFGNGLLQTWNHDPQTARLQVLRVGIDSSLGHYLHREYSYDLSGNITTILNPQGQNQSFGYDHRDRLTSWTRGSTTQSLGYDALGNLTSRAGSGYSYGSNGQGGGAGPHQLRSVSGQSAFSLVVNAPERTAMMRSVSFELIA
jgi:YD repeat-containing protein